MVKCVKSYGFRIYQWGYGEGVDKTPLYLTTMTVGNLARADIDRWTRGNREGYQRAVRQSRFSERGRNSIVVYLLKEIGVFPTSVLLNIRGDIAFKPTQKINDETEYGEITISNDAMLWIIDGQHRIEALKRTMHTKPEISNYPVPVTLTNFQDKFDEMLQFYIVNSRQKKIPTDLVYRHLQTMAQKVVLEDKKWIKSVILGPKEERVAMASFIVDFLDEDEMSPFQGKIQFAGEKKEPHFLVSDYGLSSWIIKILTDRSLSQMDDITLAEKISEYWDVIRELYPTAFSDPKGYTLLKSTGIGTYTYLFPTIFATCAAAGNVSREGFRDLLSMLHKEVKTPELHPDFQIPIDDNWWSRAHGPSIASATGQKMVTDISKAMALKIRKVKSMKEI